MPDAAATNQSASGKVKQEDSIIGTTPPQIKTLPPKPTSTAEGAVLALIIRIGGAK